MPRGWSISSNVNAHLTALDRKTQIRIPLLSFVRAPPNHILSDLLLFKFFRMTTVYVLAATRSRRPALICHLRIQINTPHTRGG